jgi:O-antigen/teichoic acid export membrane protein
VAGLLSSAADASTRALERAIRFTALLSGGILAVVLPPLYFLLPVIYGSRFRSAAYLLVPLVAVSCIQSCVSPVLAFLNARRRSGLILRVYAVALAVDVAVAVAAIPPLGVWGAVLSNMAGQVTAIAMLVLAETRDHARPDTWLLVQGRACGIGMAALVAAIGIPTMTMGSSVVGAAPAALIGTIGYGLGVRFLDAGPTEGDRAALAGSVHPRLGRILLSLGR